MKALTTFKHTCTAALAVSTVFISLNSYANSNNVEVADAGSSKVFFRQLRSETGDSNTKVTGTLTTQHGKGLPWGHVDIAAYDSSGELIAKTTTDYSPRILSPEAKQRRNGVRFSADLPTLPADATIKVAYHLDSKVVASSKPVHSENIAK